MKLHEYGIIVAGDSTDGRFKISGKELPKLINYKFSYRKNSIILIYKNGYRQLGLKFERGRIQVRLFAIKQSVPIMSYVERHGFSGLTSAGPLFNTICASVTKQLETRKRNLDEIKEILVLINQISKSMVGA